ncbi:MAG TPA: efflux RND transporter permease subunit [Gemmataceae bacterium]|nr:efflux RND transporter permease subunit [Gemmataceae bacterium]
MIARFFVDRPVFATVISVVIVLAGLVAWDTLPIAQYPDVTPPTVLVTAVYPGANATTVRDTVAAPIEEQISGVEGMLYMNSTCTNDGAYNLVVTFKMGTNSDMAQVLVQNRVSLALPVIPPLVQNEGITVKKMSPNTLMIVNLISPDRTKDDIFLSNYATIYVKDELGRVEGVAGITYLGQRDYSMRAWLDPDKLAALNLGAMDVVAAIAQQNIQVAGGQIGQPPVPSRAQQFQLTINTQGRLSDPDQFQDIIVKSGSSSSPMPANPNGASAPAAANGVGGPTPQSTGIVYLRDVVRENRYYVRIRLDPAKLASRGLRAEYVTRTLNPPPRSIGPDPDATRPNGEVLTWKATYGGVEAPIERELADTRIPLPPTPLARVRVNGDDSSLLSPAWAERGTGNGAEVRLGDLVVSDHGIEHIDDQDELGVQLGSQQYDQSCTLDGQPSVALSIYQLPGSNALNTAQGVRDKMKELKTRFPKGVDYRIVYDTTPFIKESVTEVFLTLRDAVILVAIVVLLFLQDWRAMILPMIDVPVSLIGTFAIMKLLGFTLNNLTLFGLVLAIGIVVDDAIVVLENIERQIARGLDARSATIKAMEEITGPVCAITLVLAAVFIPCCFLGGISGQFFRQFAVTIAVSTIISAVNALTMTPSRAVMIFKTEETHAGHAHRREALPWWIFAVVGGVITWWLGPQLVGGRFGLPAPLTAAEGESTSWSALAVQIAWYAPPGCLLGGLVGWFLIRPVNAGLGWIFRGFNRIFDRMTEGYGWAVSKTLRLSVIVLLLYGGLLGITWWQFTRAPAGFIPQQDKGYLLLNIQLQDAAAVDTTKRVMARIEKIVRGDKNDPQRFPGVPGVEHTVGVSGQSLILSANAPNLGSMYVLLKPFDQRRGATLTADTIAREIQDRCHRDVRGAIVTAFGAPPVEGLGTTGGFKLIIEDRGNLGPTQLQRVSDGIVERGKNTPGLEGLFNSSRANTPWLYLDIDRTKCLALGLQVSDVFNTLQVYLGSYYVNNFNVFGRTWQVVVQADQRFRAQVPDILKLQVRNNQGQEIRLGTLMDVRDTSGPVMVLRYNLYSAAAITGNASPDISSGQAADLMQTIADKEMPPSMAYDWTELTYLQLQAGNVALFAFGLAVVFVFLVLAAQYESWKLPLAVILVVPMCLLCSIVGVVVLNRMEVTIFTQIGFVVLVGLASKNAILIVEFAKQRHETGTPPREAVVEAARLRLRPILMTSFAFILGVVPLVIAAGAGAEMRRSLGVAVFCGMLGVTLFGVFLTPVFFFVVQWFEKKPTQGAR